MISYTRTTSCIKTILAIVVAGVLASCDKGNKPIAIKELAYPSSSAIAYHNKQFYVMGDDARHLLMLSKELVAIDSIPLYSFTGKRMPKPIKGDIESATITQGGKLLLLGSGSLPPYRCGGWLIDPVTKLADSIRLDTLYQRFRNAGFDMLNIEGACTIPGYIVLANRGNFARRQNHLILVRDTFWSDQHLTPFAIIALGPNTNSKVFNGVSGLDYIPDTDELLIAVSTEHTSSNTGDGAIGKSYLWIVKNFTKKKTLQQINPDTIIDLEHIDTRFKGLKIESVCATGHTKHSLSLAMVADNDDGNSTVVSLNLNRD